MIKFFANQVFSPNGAFGLLKSIAKVLIIGIVSYMIVSGKLEEIKTLMFVDDLWYSFTFIAGLCFELIVKAIIVLLLLSIVDWFFVRWQYEEQLKMKKQEIKEEFKELYGDPFVKARLKQMYQEILSQKKQIKKVVDADVVVTNPTHYAVALKYDVLTDPSPRVIAKGKDHFAQKIKEVAKTNDIYMYENVMLARTLYAEVKVNEVIPETMWEFVIVAYKLAREHADKQKSGVS